MRNALIKTIAASGIAAAAVVGVSTPSFAAGTPSGGAPQQLTVQPGPGGGAPQQLTVVPANKGAGCPAMTAEKPAVLGLTGPGCENRVSETTRNAQNLWNFGGAELGGGAANLVSSAFVGIPTFALDLIQGIFHVL